MKSNYFTLSPPSGDDYIGTESCMDLQNDIEVEHCDTSSKTKGSALKSSSKKKEKREFPPPIPLLSGAQNVPWVLKRYVTGDGRLILKEEKVRRHEYFRAHRSNGRLALQLVPLDEEEEGGVVDEESSDHSVINNSTDVHDESSVDELPMESDKGAVGGAHGGSKCLNCNGVRSSSCVFGVPMHPVRTVHG